MATSSCPTLAIALNRNGALTVANCVPKGCMMPATIVIASEIDPRTVAAEIAALRAYRCWKVWDSEPRRVDSSELSRLDRSHIIKSRKYCAPMKNISQVVNARINKSRIGRTLGDIPSQKNLFH